MKSNALRFLLATLTDLDIDDDRSSVFDAETKGVVIGVNYRFELAPTRFPG